MKKTFLFCLFALLLLLISCENEPSPIQTTGTDQPQERVRVRSGNALDFGYNLFSDNTIEIIEYTGNSTHLIVPTTVDGIPVVKICEGTFKNSMFLSVEISPNIIEIEDRAFQKCILLKEVELPDSVTKIGKEVFDNCTSLKKVKLSPNITEIKEGAFYYCTSLEQINIPDGVKTIDDEAFAHCEKLESIVLPDSVTEIGESAFSGCKSLKSINIPKDVKVIKEQTFSYCSSLESVELPEGLLSIEKGVFWLDSSSLLNNQGLKNINIPKSVLRIGEKAFLNTPWFDKQGDEFVIAGGGVLIKCNTDKPEIVIPDDVIALSDAFTDNKKITKITIPSSVSAITENAFAGCSSLSSIEVKDGSYAQKWCSENGFKDLMKIS